jgi:integrase
MTALKEAQYMARLGGKDRGLFQRKDSSAWWIQWTCAQGHEHMEKIGNKSTAREVYQQRKVAVKTEGFCLTQDRAARRREQALLFAIVAERYLAWSHEERPRSAKFRRTRLTHLVPVFGQKPLQAITRDQVEAYIRQRKKTAARPATVNREREVLSHLFARAIDWGLTEHNPVAGVERLPEENENPRPLTPDEEARLFAVLPERYKPLVTLALHTGLRLNELRTQLWRDVHLAAFTLRVTLPKSKKLEILPLNSTAFALLEALPQTSDVLFPDMPTNMSHSFAHYTAKVGLTDVTFHCLWDTYISRLAPHVSVPTLMRLARHRSFATTQRYLKFDDAHLREAVEKLSPVEP